MALVMLPCDLPWWGSVQKHLIKLTTTKDTGELVEEMQKIHELCNVSLDPDEDDTDPNLFVGLLNYLDNDLTINERDHFLENTLQNLIKCALKLKECKPNGGLHFSLQQQVDVNELNYDFVSSLLANAFFSTFPKRTDKSHPTLQNFNFTNFFKHLDVNYQKAKLKSILHYFDWLDSTEGKDEDHLNGSVKILRQIMSSREWLTIEDWLECTLPLCPMVIKHEGKLERVEADCLHVCFASSKIGGSVFADGNSQECLLFATIPELLCVLLNVESLEDNEVLTIENVRRLGRVLDPKKKATFTSLENSLKVTVCCMDPEDYSKLPLGQFEEDNILRELNKCLLAFQQKQTRIKELSISIINHKISSSSPTSHQRQQQRRLSPIGESLSSANSESQHRLNEIKVPIVTQDSCSTRKSASPLPTVDNNNLRVNDYYGKLQKQGSDHLINEGGMFHNRRGRFIVLGSSGELLPIKRKSDSNASFYSSLESSEDEFHSAKTSLEGESDDEDDPRDRYNKDFETSERRYTFAQRLKDALRRETSSYSGSTESSYAVGISVTGSGLEDKNIKVRRGGSRGFMLDENSITDENALKDAMHLDQQLNDNNMRRSIKSMSTKRSHKSSDYSFSTEYSSELEEVYQQFSKWLDNPILETDKGTKRELDSRELAVVRFAGSLLKRTLSESFAGVPLSSEDLAVTPDVNEDYEVPKKNKLVLNAKSLSLELARHKHRLAAQLLSELSQKPKNGLKPISTGNWGCGKSKMGDHQLKAIIQWLAASVAGAPALIYHTCSHKDLSMMDTLIRILRDRKWTVKDLTEATLRYSSNIFTKPTDNITLFEDLIGVEKSS